MNRISHEFNYFNIFCQLILDFLFRVQVTVPKSRVFPFTISAGFGPPGLYLQVAARKHLFSGIEQYLCLLAAYKYLKLPCNAHQQQIFSEPLQKRCFSVVLNRPNDRHTLTDRR